MAIRHVVTIQVAPGKAADFASAFKALQAIAQQEEGCEQYELFQSLDARSALLGRYFSPHPSASWASLSESASSCAVSARSWRASSNHGW
jgi:hypothetical protein